MNWNNVSLVVLGLAAFFGAFFVALWASLVIWTFRDMRARTRDAFAQFLASLMVLILGPFGIILYFILRPRETLAEKYERSLEEEALLQDIEERQICPGCKQPIQPDYVLCPICHTHLRQPCIHCKRLIHPRWSLCPYCGRDQKPIPGLDHAANVTLQDLVAESEFEGQAPEAMSLLDDAMQADSAEPDALPREMMAELKKEADASMAGPRDEAADGRPDTPKLTNKLRLPLAGSRESRAEPDPRRWKPSEADTSAGDPTAPDETNPNSDKETRQTLSLFRRR